MKKIVINKCYGGFSISGTAMARLQQIAPELVPLGQPSGRGLARDCAALIQVIEELGEDASSGAMAELKIVQIPDDVEWEICEYDGIEWVAESHRTWE